mgnify:CR=1 FL=1
MIDTTWLWYKSIIPSFLVQTIPMNLWKQKSCAPVGFTIPWVSSPLHKKKLSISERFSPRSTLWFSLLCILLRCHTCFSGAYLYGNGGMQVNVMGIGILKYFIGAVGYTAYEPYLSHYFTRKEGVPRLSALEHLLNFSFPIYHLITM